MVIQQNFSIREGFLYIMKNIFFQGVYVARYELLSQKAVSGKIEFFRHSFIGGYTVRGIEGIN